MAKEKEIKICPLKTCLMVSPMHAKASIYCTEKECAWWDDITGFCAITVIARFGSEGSFYRHRQEQKEALDRAKGG